MQFKPQNVDETSRAEAKRRQNVEVMALLFAGIAGSTQLKDELGDPEALALIEQHHTEVRNLLREFPEGVAVDLADDSIFLAFSRPSDAVRFALHLQSRLRRWNRSHHRTLGDRIGIHVGEVVVDREEGTKRVVGMHGLEVDRCKRVMALAGAKRILMTRFAFDNARPMLKGQRIAGVSELLWASHGYYEFKGISDPVEICEVTEAGLMALEAPRDLEDARRLEGQAGVEMVEADSARPDTWLARITTQKRVNRRLMWWGAAATALVGAAALVLPAGRSLDNLSYDLAYLLRRVEVPDEVVIVRMDRRSHDELGQPWGKGWDRRVHAALIDKMHEFGAGGIVFDIVFDQPASQPAEDEALLDAVKRFGKDKVVVAATVDLEARTGVLMQPITGPFPALRDVARWGLVNKPDENRAIRQATLGTADKEALAVEAARMVAGADLPVPKGEVWINYYGPPGTIEPFPYSQVLSNNVPPNKFAGKLVIVGLVYNISYTGGPGIDDFKTPYSRASALRSPGVEITATSCLNILRGDWLSFLSPWGQLALVIGFGIAIGCGLPMLRPMFGGIIAVLGALLLGVVAIVLTWQTHILFPWLVLCGVQIPVAYAWSLISSLETATRAGETALRPHPAYALPGKHVAPAKAAGEPTQGDETLLATNAQAKPSIPQYSLIRQIGQGAYGEVWLARDAVGLYRAVKVVHRRSFNDAEPYDREFDGIRQFTPIALRHPGLIHVLHVGRDDERGFFYYVMEAADDQRRGHTIDPDTYSPRTLGSDLQRHGHLDVKETIRLGVDLCDALQFLHSQRLVHRDLKPANILFAQGQPKLGDIGLVTAMKTADEEISFVGTKNFIPPEGPGAASADLYSLGKLLYVAVTGNAPAKFPELPLDLDLRHDREELLALNNVLLQACQPDATLRYPTAQAMMDALRQYRAETGDTSPTSATGKVP